tara:strand:- start:88 stop:1008 length:921 start_codon:yes stop_codon:yes gene_type:complete
MKDNLNIIEVDSRKLFVLGDTHGVLSAFQKIMRKEKHQDCNIIHVGDFGAGFFTDPEFEHYTTIYDDPKNLGLYWKTSIDSINWHQQILEERNIHLYIVRGNHDNPIWWENNCELIDKLLKSKGEEGENLVKDGWKNITFVPDYTIIKTTQRVSEGDHTTIPHNILCIGGAISIDRNHPLCCDKWLQGEADLKQPPVSLDKLGLICQELNVRTLITHTATDFAIQTLGTDFLMSLAKNDVLLLDDVSREHKLMHDIVMVVKPLKWYFGHYHFKMIGSYQLDGEELTGKFVEYECLQINQSVEIKNE